VCHGQTKALQNLQNCFSIGCFGFASFLDFTSSDSDTKTEFETWILLLKFTKIYLQTTFLQNPPQVSDLSRD